MVETYFSNLANVSALANKDNKFTCRKKKTNYKTFNQRAKYK